MAKVTLKNIAHSYLLNPTSEKDWAIQDMTLNWQNGGAYALLGPSGCGKSTLLNIISGLVKPTKGEIYFDELNVTELPPEKRNIAQVFQFPVIYDTMSVFDNLAFPLKNRKLDTAFIKQRVEEVAQMLGLSDVLKTRASGLTADSKQKISLGRGLVRSDINIIMFDEPLTVIDPQLKWNLRSKLKELHRRFEFTMIYVTHDQTEALTFADKIVVMDEGKVLQQGTSAQLFNQPEHTFVGHFIGSPGMNRIKVSINSKKIYANNTSLQIEVEQDDKFNEQGDLCIGIRPEHIAFAKNGIPVTIIKTEDIGRYVIVTMDLAGFKLKMIVPEISMIPNENHYVQFDLDFTHLYVNDWRQTVSFKR